MSIQTTEKEIEVCDKAFRLCVDFCERWLKLENAKLEVIRKSLESCTRIPPSIGVNIARQTALIFVAVVKIEREYKKVYSQYTAEKKKLTSTLSTVILFLKTIHALFLQV